MIFGSPMGSPVGDKITKKGDKHGEQKTCVCVCVCVCMLEPGDKIYQNGSQNDPNVDSKLTLKSMIFVICFAGSMFNVVFWPGGLLFFLLVVKGNNNKKER